MDNVELDFRLRTDYDLVCHRRRKFITKMLARGVIFSAAINTILAMAFGIGYAIDQRGLSEYWRDFLTATPITFLGFAAFFILIYMLGTTIYGEIHHRWPWEDGKGI